MQVTYNAISQNQLCIKNSLSKQIAKSRRVVFLESEIEEWFEKLDEINQAIVGVLKNNLSSLLNRSYNDEREADRRIVNVFWLLGKKIDVLIELYEEISCSYDEEFSQEQEIIDAFVSICSVMLKELLLLHVNIKDALHNNPENAKIEYAPDIQTQIEFIQQYQIYTAQNFNARDCLLPLAVAFGIGFMLGGE